MHINKQCFLCSMIPIEQRNVIIQLDKKGKTQQEISELLDCNQSSVSRLLNKYRHKGDVKDMPRSGRPTKLTKKNLAKIKKKLESEYLGYELVAIDEASFQINTNYKRIWFLKGEKPKRAFFWSNKKLIVFGALTSSAKFYYDFYVAQNSLTFCFF